jgi:hypothetical protein
MRFLFLIHGDEEGEAALSADERRAIVEEHIAYAAMLRERGAHVLGEALAGSDTAAVVRPGDTPLVTDGPFTETKEGLGGFYVVDCASREEALTSPRRSPRAQASRSRFSRSSRPERWFRFAPEPAGVPTPPERSAAGRAAARPA